MKRFCTIYLFACFIYLHLSAQNVELTANEVFFSPVGTLANVSIGDGPSDGLNQGNNYGYTKNWKTKTDTLVWGIDVPTVGELIITPFLGVPTAQNGSEVELIFSDQKKTINISATGGLTTFKAQTPVSFNVAKAGRYTLKLKINNPKVSGNVAYVQKMIVSGQAATDLKPVQIRWRPLAAHANFSNSSKPSSIILAIHEVKIVSTNIDSYSPITSPFGYYGSTWSYKNQKFGGVNFSLWTFGRNDQPPAVDKFSHLIAVGKGLYIDGFNHEGTGCKARGVNPFDEMVGVSTQVLGLKKVPGNPYDVYYSYYWNPNEKKWYLYGCGKKYNAAALSYLKTGTFVEVPGPANTQRSNHVKREVRYRGWYMDNKNNWYPADKMTTSDAVSTISYRNFGIDSDNYFYVQTGGFDSIPSTMKRTFTLTNTQTTTPEFLSPEKLQELEKLPATIVMLTPTDISHNSAVINFNLTNAGTNPKAKLYWGKTDGLTYVEGNVGNGGVVNWDKNIAVQIVDGKINYTINGLDPATKYYYRLQVINDEGETWSWDTQTFNTTDKVSSIDNNYSTNSISIWAKNGTINIENAEAGNIISVFDSSGKLKCKSVYTSDISQIKVSKGTYVVRVGDFSKNLIVN